MSVPVWLVPALLSIAAGIGVIVQQAVNAELRHVIGSAAWAGLFSFVVGTLCMVVLAFVVRDPVPGASTILRVPWWGWAGGLLGAVYIGLAILLVPRLGTTTFTALLIAGQLAAALVFDHFGLLGLTPRPADLTRILGVVLLFGGVLLVQR